MLTLKTKFVFSEERSRWIASFRIVLWVSRAHLYSYLYKIASLYHHILYVHVYFWFPGRISFPFFCNDNHFLIVLKVLHFDFVVCKLQTYAIKSVDYTVQSGTGTQLECCLNLITFYHPLMCFPLWFTSTVSERCLLNCGVVKLYCFIVSYCFLDVLPSSCISIGGDKQLQ